MHARGRAQRAKAAVAAAAAITCVRGGSADHTPAVASRCEAAEQLAAPGHSSESVLASCEDSEAARGESTALAGSSESPAAEEEPAQQQEAAAGLCARGRAKGGGGCCRGGGPAANAGERLGRPP
jgi:hypothetical protein